MTNAQASAYPETTYPYPLEPIYFIVKQNLGIGDVNVAVVGIIEKVP